MTEKLNDCSLSALLREMTLSSSPFFFPSLGFAHWNGASKSMQLHGALLSMLILTKHRFLLPCKSSNISEPCISFHHLGFHAISITFLANLMAWFDLYAFSGYFISFHASLIYFMELAMDFPEDFGPCFCCSNGFPRSCHSFNLRRPLPLQS